MEENNNLKLEHLAPYLPYGLECVDNNGDILLISHYTPRGQKKLVNIGELVWSDSIYTPKQRYKPILRPLSDLEKKHLDYMYFFIIATDNDMFGSRSEFEDYFNETSHEYLPQCLFEYLLKCHFDMFRLIEKGLAIDINALNK